MKQCEVCGKTEGNIVVSKKFNKTLCNRHYMQMISYGEIKERTIRDSNEIIIDGDIAYIVIYTAKGKEKCRAIIDTKNVDLVSKYKWNSDNKGYIRSGVVDGKALFLHRLIIGGSDEFVVDHIDTNKSNNMESNLRLCTNQENCRNKNLYSHNTSGYRGVSWHKDRQKWQAGIVVNKKQIYLGIYSDKKDAIKVCKEAEIKYFGDFRYKASLCPSVFQCGTKEVSA